MARRNDRRARQNATDRALSTHPYPTGRSRSHGAHAFERFDDDHPAAAARAFMCAVNRIGAAIWLGLLLWRGLGDRQQSADALDVVGSHPAGEQAVMADAVKAARQH